MPQVRIAPRADNVSAAPSEAVCRRPNALNEQMASLARNIEQGHQSLASLHQSAETNLQLAEQAEAWRFKQMEAKQSNAEAQ